MVGNNQVDEPWLDETLTQYSMLYFETRYGSDRATDLLENNFQKPYQALQDTQEDMPIGLPVAAYNEREYSVIVYRKGLLYFHELRQEVDEETYTEVLRTYFKRYRYGIATPEG